MPVQIGAKAHDFSDPTGLLSDCHRRIEMFLRSLERVAKVIDTPLTEEARTALETAQGYFHDAAPKHTQDEEESLFPRLRQIQTPEVGSALSALDALENDHRRADLLHAEVHQLGLKCLQEGNLVILDADRFRQAIAELAAMYCQHIKIEDSIVFPMAKRTLSGSQQSAIASEMASRRQLVSQSFAAPVGLISGWAENPRQESQRSGYGVEILQAVNPKPLQQH
jgi:hemerythrin-like domain-containing protein